MDFLLKKSIFIYMEKYKPGTKFIDYFSKPLTFDQLNYLNTLNCVTIEKVDLFRDFTLTLAFYIYDTYLGDDIIVSDENVTTHFNWCWNKTIKNLKEENIHIAEKGEHYYYYWNYFNDKFYNADNKEEYLFNFIYNFWSEIISIDKVKTRSEYDLFIEMYKTMNKSFSNKR